MELEVDGYRFNFPTALELFKFDEIDKTKPMFHGAPMKGVDLVAEFADKYLYIEIKDYDEISDLDTRTAIDEETRKAKNKHFTWLKNYLKHKFRDSYLYRHAEDKVEKPIHYICLTNFDNGLNTLMKKALVPELPVGQKFPIGKTPRRWKRALAQSCQVLNLDAWNKNAVFSASPLQRAFTAKRTNP